MAVAYPTYLNQTGLARRVRIDWSRVRSLGGKGSARSGGLNVLLYWLFFLVLTGLLISGLILRRGFGGWLVSSHRLLMWLVVAYTLLHIVTHFAFGGLSQLIRVFGYSSRQSGACCRRRRCTGAIAADFLAPRQYYGFDRRSGLGGGDRFFLCRPLSRDTLHIQHIAKSAAPRLNGDLSDAAWRNTPPLSIPTQQGANLDGSGESVVEIRAVHDGETAYFAFTWQDSTRSLKHLPLIKAADGWQAAEPGACLNLKSLLRRSPARAERMRILKTAMSKTSWQLCFPRRKSRLVQAPSTWAPDPSTISPPHPRGRVFITPPTEVRWTCGCGTPPPRPPPRNAIMIASVVQPRRGPINGPAGRHTKAVTYRMPPM
jgi:hypothetical protein